jgi:HD-GYP domain-containing protein (c-di-GMP phosphodiesterase class II)
MSTTSQQSIGLSACLGALSLATDLADGQPQGSAMGATVIATRIGQRLGLDKDALAALYWSALLRFLGCTASAPDLAPAGFGVEQSVNHAFTIGDPYDVDNMRQHLRAHLPKDEVPEAERDKMIEMIAGMGDKAYPFVEMHCEQARALANRLPVPKGVGDIVALRHSRWDGAAPLHPSGDALPLNARIMEFATALELHRRAGGLRSMVEVAKARSGGQFDPGLTRTFLFGPAEIISGLGQSVDLELFQSLEPGDTISIAPCDVRKVAEAYADFIDIKSRYYLGHSRRVAGLAYRAAVASSADEASSSAVFNAALLHDLGKSAVPTGILDKPVPLTRMEELRLRSHSFHTEQILAVSPVFDAIREMACSVEERCDGSGYHRHIRLGEGGAALIAVANYYDELTHDLPSRKAMEPGAAAETLLAEVSAGRMPRDAARLVLDSAGHRREVSQAALPDGLTPREAEVLRQLAHGLSTKEIARTLSVSPKTVDNQTQSIYRKIGAKSRTAAALYAMENGIFAA